MAVDSVLLKEWVQKRRPDLDVEGWVWEALANDLGEIPEVNKVLVKLVREGKDEAFLDGLIKKCSKKRSQSATLTVPGSPPSSQPSFFDRLRLWRQRKKERPVSVEVESPGLLSRFSGLFPSNKKLLIGIGIGLVVILAGVLLYLSYFGGRVKGISFPVATSVPVQEAVALPKGEGEEVRPVLDNPTPIDLQSNSWFGSLQLLLPVEVFGLALALAADAKTRKQPLDAVVPFLAFLIVVFVPGGKTLGSWGVLLIPVIPVILVSIMGGKDFSPIGTFLTLVGAVGGLIVNKIEAVQSALSIQTAPILPFEQMAILYQTQSWDQFYFPLVVYVLLVGGVIMSCLEAIRPSEDKNPRWGTVIGGGLGLVAFFVMVHFVPSVPAWCAYVVSFSLAVGLSAISQNERMFRQVTDLWGIRTMFDAAMLMTSILVVCQLFTGKIALY